MNDLLNHYPVYFPKRNEELFTLKQFLTNTKYQLPIIVNITSLNNYGRSIKHFLTKNTQLLLIGIYELESILAEYHRSHDGHRQSYRQRLTTTQGKMVTKASTKFLRVKKLSKSLASLTTTTTNQTNNTSDDDDDDDSNDSTYHQRNLVKNLNEKRSKSIPLCRIPIQYQRFFELLNENDQSVEPYHKLIDLILPEYINKQTEKWPHAFFLRSSCSAYTQKNTLEYSNVTSTINDNSTASNDSCYSSLSDLDSQKNLIILNDQVQILQAGQILTILGDCIAFHTQIMNKDVKEQRQSPTFLNKSSWFRDKSRILFFKKRRRSQPAAETISNLTLPNKSISKKYESYLKCQTQQGDIVYIPLHETGLFSPLNFQKSPSKSNTNLTNFDISEVYQLKTLLSNFRFPISVRHLDGSICFENNYSPASINQHETATKLRLLMPYNENVVFACPINLVSSKSSKTSSPYFIIPLSVNADIEIQPCSNMHDISKTDDFHKLIDICFQLIKQHQNEISLIHFPLQFTTTNNINGKKQLLYKTRSQSESFVEYLDDNSKYQFRHSDEQLNFPPSISSPLRYRDSIETIKQKLSTDQEQTNIQIKKKRHSQDNYTSEDEMYQDVDKIYDYIRSGDITIDVEKIQARERKYHSSQTINLPTSTNKESEQQQQLTTVCPSPGKMVTHRFVPKIEQPRTSDQTYDLNSCKNDGNVDDDQAHALYIAAKQRTKPNSPDLLDSKPITKMKRINKP